MNCLLRLMIGWWYNDELEHIINTQIRPDRDFLLCMRKQGEAKCPDARNYIEQLKEKYGPEGKGSFRKIRFCSGELKLKYDLLVEEIREDLYYPKKE